MTIQARSRAIPGSGHRAGSRLFSVLIAAAASLAVACGDDDPAPQTGLGGGGGTELDASARELPGDGVEPTPATDIDMRQRNPIGPQRLNETLDEIRDDIEQGSDAGAGDADAAPDAGAS